MQREPAAFLWDVLDSALAIGRFTADMDGTVYAASEMAQSAVERKFEVIGEALNQLSKLDPGLAAHIPDLPHIVAFRNQLIHGYARVEASTVWNVVQDSLPKLLDAVQSLLGGLGKS